MDILYQYYSLFLEKLGFNESIIFILWSILPFSLAVIAFFIIPIIVAYIDKKTLLLIKNKNCTLEIDTKINNFNGRNLALIMVLFPSILLWGLIPYSNKYIPISSEVSLILFITTFSFLLFNFLLFAKNDEIKKSVIKVVFQITSFILPILFSLLSIVSLTSTFNLNEIVLSQSLIKPSAGWLITPSIIGFFVFILGIVGILITLEKYLNLSSLCFFNAKNKKIKILLRCYYSAIFMFSLFTVCLFLGGYLPPLGFYFSEIYQINYVLNNSAVYIEQIFWLLIKTILLTVFILGFKTKFVDIDETKLIKISWVILLPASIINLIICMIIPFLGGC